MKNLFCSRVAGLPPPSTRGGVLLLPFFIVLLLGLRAIPALAGDSDSVTVNVTVEAVRVISLEQGTSFSSPDLTNIPFNIGQSEIEAGEAYLYCPQDYLGYAVWQANTTWKLGVYRTAWSPTEDFGLYVRTDTQSWYEVVVGTSDPDPPWQSDGAGQGYYDLDWKLTGLGWDVAPGTYTSTVTFEMYAE